MAKNSFPSPWHLTSTGLTLAAGKRSRPTVLRSRNALQRAILARLIEINADLKQYDFVRRAIVSKLLLRALSFH